MNLLEFLQDLAINGWKFWSEKGTLLYRAPKEESNSFILEQLKQHKAEILQLVQENPSLFNLYPLSYGQKGLWFLWQLAPESYAYNVSFPARISSAVDITAIKQVFRTLIKRHPILRTTFPKRGQEPIQQVHQNPELEFLQIDASAWDEDRLTAKVIEAHQTLFDLENGPVMRVRWFTCSEHEHILLLTIHHIACDRWSIDVLIQEFAQLYQAQQTHVEVSLPPLRHSYEDYVRWQRKMLSGTQGEELWNYWQNQLAGELPSLNLPIDRPRPPVQTYNGASHEFKLSSQLTEQLKKLAQIEGVTFYMLLLAAFKVLLYRYTGQDDLLVGSPTANRSKPEFAAIFGYFADPVIIRTNLSNNSTFKEFLGQVRQRVLEALTHQDYPFALLVEKLQPYRDPSRSPIFQASFDLLQLQQSQDIQKLIVHEAEQDIDWGGLKLKPFKIPHNEGQFDLDLEMIEGISLVFGTFKYNRDLFNGATIERMTNHFQNLLSAIVESPQQAISQFPLLSKAEHHQILVEWNETATEYPSDRLIHQLFEEQVERTPNAVAVVFNTEQLTYRELNQRANQLAHCLQTFGVKPEVLVGIYMERSVEMVVALLAILKAGGAYVPLDLSYPQDRLSYMLEDSSIGVLLTHSSLLASVPQNQARAIALDKNWASMEQYSQDNVDSRLCSDNLAYVIYTSGSTGKPKGVAMNHRPLVNLIHWQLKQSSAKYGTRTGQFTPISFDVSFQEILSTWCSGGTLVLIPEDVRRDGTELLQFLSQQKVERLFLPFVALEQLATSASEAQFLPSNLCELITAGEQLQITPTLVKFFDRLLNCKLENQYGPTETHVVSAFRLQGCPSNWSSLPPIGRPIANTQIYILDKYLQPVPVGVPGELYIGGDGLARGYLNRPELTQEKFIQNPFSNSKSERLYKTGDLARYLSNGNIEFLGRIDNQLKVRGFRIEPGEIEAVLNTHPKIEQAVVIATENTPGNKRLVAYLVTSDESFTSNELHQYLKQKLPDYMIPRHFILLEKLPLTPSGKIDRKALPAAELQHIETKELTPATTATQQKIADLFAALLKIPAVGIHNNFFELGGHSLLATQLMAHLQQTFHIQLPLRTLFECPTVAQLGQIISQQQQTEAKTNTDPNLPTLTPAPDQRYQPFPLTEIQQAYWLGRNSAFELGNIASHLYIELDCQNLDLERLNSAWQKIIHHHDMMRMVVLPDGQQQILPQVPSYHIETFDLTSQSQPTQTRHLETIRQQMSHQVFDGETWPLFKLCATRLGQQHYRLHLSFDALIADALSLMNFGQQWWQLYQNPQATLPQLQVSFRDYVLAELALRDTPQYQRAQDYWQQRLSTLPSAPELPLAQPLSSLKQPQFKRFSSRLNPQQWQQLQQKAHQANLTASSLLLTAFSDILTTWSKSPHFTINLTLFHRLPLHPQVNQIVGDFTSLTLLEVNHSTPASFIERAKRLQAQLWQDLDHRYVSGVAVQRQLRQQRGSTQIMGVVFTSTLGISDLTQQDWWVNQFGEMVYGITQTPQVWLDHQVIEQQGTLQFNWDVVEELFPPGMVDEMFRSYCDYLQQLATEEHPWQQTHPQLLPPQQLQQLQQVNQTETAIFEQTLDGLFIDQAQKQPTALAVIAPQLSLTYEQLYQRALKLAHQLRQLGVTPPDRIAIVMEKGWEQVVALLGILMSGAAYVPIDPELPQQRQWSLLLEAQVQWVVTQTSLSSKLSWPEGINCLCVEDNPPTTALAPLEPLHQPRDLAYIIYTSGSTGRPKGVMIEHLAAVNTLLDINQRFGITCNDRILAVSALNFDLSVYDILGILAAGGTIVLPSAKTAKDPAHWLSLLNAHQITLWNSVPALMQMLVEHSSTQPTPVNHSLRLVLLSGDWLPLNLPQQIQALWTDVQVVSLGGATEASIWSIYYPIREVQPHWRSIPYGKPLGNQTLQILNCWMTPTPVGVPGQIYIGGKGLARSYWQDEQKTRSSFMTHPLTQERLYKTGDWGCYLPDGNIEFLGREDFQVKIRGYRIELGEIEAALIQHPLVKQAVVLAVGDSPEKRQLVAYIVPSQTRLKLPEAYQPQDKQGMIVDPIERIEFKLKQPGLRRFASTQASVELPLEIEDEALTQAYLERQSYRQFQQYPLELQRFSQFLSCLRQLKLGDIPLPKYLYPSAGNLYPVQTYVLIKPERICGVAGGIYYYCPRQHRLVRLAGVSEFPGDVYGANQPIFEQAAFSLFLIGQLDAIYPMYGQMAQKFCLLEAGHMGQLLMSTAPQFDLGLCPIGDLDWARLSDGFELDANQLLLYSFVGGRINPTQKKWWLTWPDEDDADWVDQLRQHLLLHLPEYMFPVEFVELDCLPLSANGKVDRLALPVPNSLPSSQPRNFIAPRTPVEQDLARIWETILHVDRVGIDDNFFEMGGDSLLATRFISRVKQIFQIDLTLSYFFENPNVNRLADYIETINWVAQEIQDSETNIEEIEL
jgi:amino acid adenylation domain-containing protein